MGWLIYLLLGIFVGIYIVVYAKINRDIFSPSLLFLLAYIVSVGCAVLNVKRWNIDMWFVTFAVLLIGALEFIIIGLLVDKKYERIWKKTRGASIANHGMISIAWWKMGLTIVFCIVYLILLGVNVMEIASRRGSYHSFSEALTLFKDATSMTLTYSLPWWLEQMERIVMICAYIYLYVFLRNVVWMGKGEVKEAIFKKAAYIIPVILYIFNGILMSDRLMILQILIAGIIMCFLEWTYKTGEKFISLKTIFMLVIAACIGLVIFYISAEFVGRINSKGLFEYITYYCGGSIECLNQYFKDPPMASELFGKETFYNLNRKLFDLGLLNIDEFYPIHLEFRFYHDVMLGNVYTAYRRWIQDFGFAGAFLLQGIMAFIMSAFYNRVKYGKFKNSGFWIVLYGYLVYTVVLHPIDGYFYLQCVSQTFVTTLLLMWLGYWFFTQLEISLKGGFSIHINSKWIFEKGRLQRRENGRK